MRKFTASLLGLSILLGGWMVAKQEKQPLSVRNNNPCNIKYNPKNKWKGSVYDKGNYEKFKDKWYGMRACLIVVFANTKKTNSVEEFVLRFATEPHEDMNDEHIANYAKAIEYRLDYKGKIQPYDSIKILRTIVKHEGGQQALDYYKYYLPKD